MYNRFLVLMILLAGLLAARFVSPHPAATAQGDTPWSLYLIDAGEQQLIQIDLDGNQTTVPLPVAANTFVGPADIVINPDGTLVAFTTFMWEDDTTTQTLTVMTLPAAEVIFEQTYVDTHDIRVAGFDTTGQRLALGIVDQLFIGQNDGIDTLWSLQILDVATGEWSAVLQDSREAVQALPERVTEIAYMPQQVLFEGDTISFTQVPWIGSGIDQTFGVIWDIAADTVTDAPQFASPVLARNTATTELAQIIYDAGAPAAAVSSPVTPFNAVQVVQADNRATVFRTAEAVVLDVRFIDNGTRLAIQLLSGAAQNERTNWIALGRAGGVMTLTEPTANTFAEIRGAPDGYVTLSTTYPPDFSSGPAVTLTYTVEGGSRVLWLGDGDFYNIVWHAPLAFRADVTPFLALE